MKKFLLVLSCCLATWCSVLAGPKSSPEISLMQASAPAPTYPAVIKSATYNSKTNKIDVSFTVNIAGKVAFSLDGGKTNAWSSNGSLSKGGHTANVPLKSVPPVGSVVSIVISVDGGICGGLGVYIGEKPQPKTSVSVGEISHDAVNKVVTVNYIISNSTSGTTEIIVRNNDKASDVYKKSVSSSLRSCQLPSSIFAKNTDYSIKVINGEGSDAQNFKITDNPAGHITEVSFCKSAYDDTSEYAAFKYNLQNTYNPYIYIMEGARGEYGPIVEKIKIRNTNGVYVNAILHDYRSILREKTTYTAYLYDIQQNGKERNLGICKEFKIPTEFVKQKEYPEWHFDEGANELVIRAPQSWPKYLKNISIMVYSNNGGALTPQGNATATNLGDWVRIRIPDATINRYYTIVVTAGGSYHCDITMPIRK